MFGNLKNKLGEVADLKKFSTPQVLSSLTSSRQQSVNHSPGSDTPIRLNSQQSSSTSQNGLQNVSNNSSVATGNNKEKEMIEIKNLKIAMEEQQKVFKEKLSMKEQEWLTRLQEQERKAVLMERQLINIRDSEKSIYKQLREKENIAAANSISSAHYEAKLKETEKQLELLQDNYDQLEGLGTQEVAKIKHLLLNTCNELEITTGELNTKIAELEKLNQDLVIASGTVSKYNILVEEKMELDTTVAGLRQKLNNANLKIVTTEKDSEGEMQNLQEKISILENRIQQNSMEVDDRTTALTEERKALDNLLEEKRQEVTNIKMSWSQKIYNLENQILSLNEKMAEDQMELKCFEETVYSLTKEVEELNTQTVCSKEMYNKEVILNTATIYELKEQLQTIDCQNVKSIAAKDEEIKDGRKNIHKKDEELLQLKEAMEEKERKLMQLNDFKNESKVKLDETNIKLTSVQEECKVLKSAHESLANSHSSEKSSRENLEQELLTMKHKYETVLSEKHKLSANLDELSKKVTVLETDLSSSSEKNSILTEKYSEAEVNRDEYRTKYEESKSLMEESQLNLEQTIIQSDIVKSLKEKCQSLEDELVDAKQKFKVQKQRMEDMKKTLQKEFKISPNNADTTSEINNVNTMEGIPIVGSRKDLGVMTNRTDFFQGFSSFSNSDIETINISYLKHVLLKFITSRESEAIQLVKAIGALLHMTNEEEELLAETMRWKMSWFGSKPNLGKGQTAKDIPPSQ